MKSRENQTRRDQKRRGERQQKKWSIQQFNLPCSEKRANNKNRRERTASVSEELEPQKGPVHTWGEFIRNGAPVKRNPAMNSKRSEPSAAADCSEKKNAISTWEPSGVLKWGCKENQGEFPFTKRKVKREWNRVCPG